MRLFLLIATTTLSLALPGLAQAQTALVDRYYAALNMAEVFEILRDEGIAGGEEITKDGDVQASPSWTRRLQQIYALDKMDAEFREGMIASGALEGSDEAIAFFETEAGKRIVRIELDARIALNDEALEDDIRQKVEKMRADKDPRIELYENFVIVNDLIDSNVMGALNSNLAFYQGMASNPQFDQSLPEGVMLSTVWEQEPEIRENVTDWTMNFSALAYSVLSLEELQAYIDMSASEAGQKFNTALFAGFDQMFEQQSYELGQATAEFMMGDDT